MKKSVSRPIQTVRREMHWLWLTLMLFLSPSHAVSITPTVLTMDIQHQPQIIVTNNSNRHLPIEVSLWAIDFHSIEGAASPYALSPVADEHVLVFPPAFMLAPQTSQSIRLLWQSEQQLSHSQSYFVRFSEPQLKVTNNQTDGVDVQLHYNALVHITSNDQRADLHVLEASTSAHNLTLKVENRGNRFAYLEDYQLRTAEDEPILATPIEQSLGNLFLPPQSISHLTIPITAVLNKTLRLESTTFAFTPKAED
ncbi:hypothetical protein [Thaumasiovibrio subtropicus]|uniref:hypothetical protein n=1 Tax=Thaumasiovibrio subtropicus TaxID=1891207 RepID=UPI00131D551A|nr:hypothetical protein [Thaumasiovibrio subtropicus]